MSDSLGLSIGVTNLVAAKSGRPPVVRRSVLTLFDDRAPEVGVPSENPNLNQPGTVLSGFVERVGDPAPLIAADGSPHQGEQVLVEALAAMARTVGGGTPIAIAVPAYWSPAAVGALRGALRGNPDLAPGGVAPALVPDSVAALTALKSSPGLPANGVVVLCDFGAGGTSITLADAESGLNPIDQTVRYPDFSGNQIDQALLNHVVARVAEASAPQPAGTAAASSIARLRNESRRAKEQLSTEAEASVHAELPNFNSDVRITRAELEQLIAQPLAGVFAAIEQALQRNNIERQNVAAVAAVGGGANIPLVTAHLAQRLQVPVVAPPGAQLTLAGGAALLAGIPDDATGMAAAADTPTGLAPTAGWVAGAAGAGAAAAGAAAAAGDTPTGLAPTAGWDAADGGATAMAPAGAEPTSAAYRPLAWSQDDAPGAGEPVPYTGEDYTFDPAATTAAPPPPMEFSHEEEGFTPETAPLPWYKRPTVLFGAAAAAVLLAVGGLVVTLTGGTSGLIGPVTETATTVETGPSPEGPPTSETITMTGTDGQTTTTVVPPTTTTTTTTSSETSTTTTTTTTTTSTTTTTTTTPPTTTTTTAPPTTTTAPPVTTTPPVVTTTVEEVIPDEQP